jgi:hypothetical protein
MERKDATRRLWVELEISRADPVANHAKFATGHLFAPLPATDSFISMISSHIERGRRNLAANTIFLMRKVGIDAYQVPLLPTTPPDQIKALNHSTILAIAARGLDVTKEIERCLTLSEPVLNMSHHRILFASNTMEVLLNVQRWKQEMETPSGRALWGRRRGQYFVFSPGSSLFAPSKFCAFTAADLPSSPNQRSQQEDISGIMPLRLYVTLDETESRFDGRAAWRHLVSSLGFTLIALSKATTLSSKFNTWLSQHANQLAVNTSEAVILTPPAWA